MHCWCWLPAGIEFDPGATGEEALAGLHVEKAQVAGLKATLLAALVDTWKVVAGTGSARQIFKNEYQASKVSRWLSTCCPHCC